MPYHKWMDYVISHISALECWRQIGRHDGCAALPDTRAKLPKTLPLSSQLENKPTLLTVPLHCYCAQKQKSQRAKGVTAHYAKTALPPNAIRRLSERVGIVSPELALLQIANEITLAELAGLITEFCGRYSIQDNAPHGMFSREPLTTVKKVSSFSNAVRGLTGATALRTASHYALDNSRSPAETAAALLLTLPRMRGGYGLRGACLNPEVNLSAMARAVVGTPSLKPDIMWPKARLCIEYDSHEFHFDTSRVVNDARRKNALLLSNLHVITLTKTQLFDRREMDKIAKHVAAKTGKRWAAPNLQQHTTLRNELLGAASVLRRSQEILRRTGQHHRIGDESHVRSTSQPNGSMDKDTSCEKLV